MSVDAAGGSDRGGAGRAVIGGALLLLPMGGLVLLLARPAIDRRWEHHPSHFWLVLGVALLNVGLGVATSEAARRRGDARLFLVSLALLPLGIARYLLAAARYAILFQRRGRTLLLAVSVSFVLLAEALVAVAFGRSWHASWWEWHMLMAVAFGAVTAAARIEFRREGSLTGAFSGIYLDRTLERFDRRSSEALRVLVAALKSEEPLAPVLEGLRKEGFATEELTLME